MFILTVTDIYKNLSMDASIRQFNLHMGVQGKGNRSSLLTLLKHQIRAFPFFEPFNTKTFSKQPLVCLLYSTFHQSELHLFFLA